MKHIIKITIINYKNLRYNDHRQSWR